MSARDDILSSIRMRRGTGAPKPETYVPPITQGDLSARFAERAAAANADIRVLNGDADIPGAIAEILRARNMAATIHLPPDGDLESLPWQGGVTLSRAAPGPDDAALTLAPFAIAETGTLVYPARASSPASWHFRAGLEIAILRQSTILAHFEDVLASLKAQGALAGTVNLVTGPSRTGDIEQTLELGAHGPKALAILIVPD